MGSPGSGKITFLSDGWSGSIATICCPPTAIHPRTLLNVPRSLFPAEVPPGEPLPTGPDDANPMGPLDVFDVAVEAPEQFAVMNSSNKKASQRTVGTGRSLPSLLLHHQAFIDAIPTRR
jgi:hypothetical protein